MFGLVVIDARNPFRNCWRFENARRRTPIQLHSKAMRPTGKRCARKIFGSLTGRRARGALLDVNYVLLHIQQSSLVVYRYWQCPPTRTEAEPACTTSKSYSNSKRGTRSRIKTKQNAGVQTRRGLEGKPAVATRRVCQNHAGHVLVFFACLLFCCKLRTIHRLCTSHMLSRKMKSHIPTYYVL